MSAGLADLIARVETLEQRKLGLSDIPLATLQRKLENDWQPDANVLIQPRSITAEQIARPIDLPQPNAQVTHSTAQAFATATSAQIVGPWDAVGTGVSYDSSNTWDPTNSRFVARESGLYLVGGSIHWADTAVTAGRRGLLVHFTEQGGASADAWEIHGASGPTGGTATQTRNQSTRLWRAKAGDIATFWGFQDSGGALSLSASLENRFWVVKLAAY